MHTQRIKPPIIHWCLPLSTETCLIKLSLNVKIFMKSASAYQKAGEKGVYDRQLKYQKIHLETKQVYSKPFVPIHHTVKV